MHCTAAHTRQFLLQADFEPARKLTGQMQGVQSVVLHLKQFQDRNMQRTGLDNKSLISNKERQVRIALFTDTSFSLPFFCLSVAD